MSVVRVAVASVLACAMLLGCGGGDEVVIGSLERRSVELERGTYCPAIDATQEGLLPVVRTDAQYDVLFAHPNCQPVPGTLPPRPDPGQALLLYQRVSGCNGCRPPLGVDVVSNTWIFRVLQGPDRDCDAEIPVGAWALVRDEHLLATLSLEPGPCR